MRLSDEFRDPWALLVAGVAGGAAWAVGVPAVAAAGVGAVVLGVKAAGALLMGRRRTPRPRMLPVRARSQEDKLLRRAEGASRSFDDLARSIRPGPIAERSRLMGERVRSTIETMRRLAGQTSAVAGALARIDPARLRADAERIADELKRTRNEEVRAEKERSLEYLREQLDVERRLRQAGQALLARMDSGAIGIESLVARLAEVLALAETTATPEQGVHRIEELSDELEGLRSGLVETEEASKRALSAYRQSEGVPQVDDLGADHRQARPRAGEQGGT